MDEQYFNSLEDSRIKQREDWGTLWGAQYIANYCWQTPGDTAQHECPGTALTPKMQLLSSESQWSHQTMNLSIVGGNDIWGVSDTPVPEKSYSSVAGS